MKLCAAISILEGESGSSEYELKGKILIVQIAHSKKDNIWLALLMKCINPSWNIPSRLGEILFQLFLCTVFLLPHRGLIQVPWKPIRELQLGRTG